MKGIHFPFYASNFYNYGEIRKILIRNTTQPVIRSIHRAYENVLKLTSALFPVDRSDVPILEIKAVEIVLIKFIFEIK